MTKRHKDDSMSVTMMVSELKEELFMPQGSQDPGFPTLSVETFVLAIQTQFQMELYHQYASTILCIDSTHGTNQYCFELITYIVQDDHGKGQPVAWCIANSETSEVVEIFFGNMKARSPMIPVRVLMTDDGELNRYCLYNPDGYTVTCHHTTCPECSLQSQHDGVTCTAPECQFLCPHMYICDKKCYDFNNEHICKHIHKKYEGN